MQKSNDFRAKDVLNFLADISPLLIIATMIIFLSVIAIVQFNYLNDSFSKSLPSVGIALAILLAFGFAGGRLAFGLSGARDIKNGKILMGGLGLFATLLIAGYEHYEVSHIVETWETPELSVLLKFSIWLAVIAEIRLLMTIHSDHSAKEHEETAQPEPQLKPQKQAKPQPTPAEEFEELAPLDFGSLNLNLEAQ